MKILTAIVLFLLVILVSQEVRSQYTNEAKQLVMLEVKPISKISLAGNLNAFMLTGDQTSISDNTTRYSLTTNVDNMKIVASINNQMPAGTNLKIRLASRNASSNGVVDVSQATSPVTVVSGIHRGIEVDQTISYEFSAASEIRDLPNTSRSVTFTLTN